MERVYLTFDPSNMNDCIFTVPDLSTTAPSIPTTYTLSSTSPFTLPLPALPSTSTADTGPPEENLLLETDSNSSLQIPSDLLMTEFPINPPPPPSLISNPPPERYGELWCEFFVQQFLWMSSNGHDQGTVISLLITVDVVTFCMAYISLVTSRIFLRKICLAS